MDYENKHREEIARATQLWECGDITRENLEYIFPELNEDERMRNIAIYACKYMVDNFENSTKQYEDAIAWLEKQGKSNWSEEDEKMLNRLIGVLDGTNKEDYHEGWEDIFLPWLKSLKDRVQPQLQPIWSDDDKIRLDRICKTLWKNRKGDTDEIYQQEQDIDWLKSIIPGKRWKPSKEQIIALRWVLNNIPYNKHKEEISGLLGQIKDL